jgi:uroporphyrinogen-III synthase
MRRWSQVAQIVIANRRGDWVMRLWVTRSRPFNSRTSQQLRSMGHDVVDAPLFKVRPLEPLEAAERPDLIAFTSLNGVLHHRFRPEWADVPVLAGGDATAMEARGCGYRHVQSAGGGVRELQSLAVSSAAVGSRLLHFSAKQPAGNLVEHLRQAGFRAVQKNVYEVEPQPFDELARVLLYQYPVDGILVHSRKSARRLAKLVARAAWSGTVFCLSRACAEDFGAIRRVSVESARTPTDLALMDAVRAAAAEQKADRAALRIRGVHLIRDILRDQQARSDPTAPDQG